MRDGQDRDEEEDEDPRGMGMEMNEPSGFEGRGGALVEEARQMMKDDDDEDPRGAGGNNENAGPKIKMNRIGKKAKKAAGGAAGGATGGSKAAAQLEDYKPQKTQGALTEKDYEFMKKAI